MLTSVLAILLRSPVNGRAEILSEAARVVPAVCRGDKGIFN
jgi:hypothetical protein